MVWACFKKDKNDCGKNAWIMKWKVYDLVVDQRKTWSGFVDRLSDLPSTQRRCCRP